MKYVKNFYLFEAIDLANARKVTGIFLKSGGKERYNEVFKGKDRLYYDFNEEGTENIKSDLYTEVEGELEKNGYTILNYHDGTAQKNGDTKNIFKIQRLLVRWGLSHLKDKMDSDPTRSGSKVKNKKIVISRHGIDLAGVSTGRGWTSCKNLIDGMNSRYVFTEAKVGALVAYLIEEDDLNIQNPLSRISISVYVNTKDPTKILLYPEPIGYGNYKKKDFYNFVYEWVRDFNKHLNPSEGEYHRSKECYNDEARNIEYYSEEKNIGINIDQFVLNFRRSSVIDYNKSEPVIKDLYENIMKEKPTEEVLLKYMASLKEEPKLINLLVNYINQEDNTKTINFVNHDLRKMSVLLKGLDKRILSISDEKSKIISEEYYKNMSETTRKNLFSVEGVKPSGEFIKWFINNIKKMGLINPEFQEI